MKMPLTRRALLSTALSMAVAAPLAAQTALEAGRPVTIVVPYAAGGMTDALARALAPRLSQRWARPVLVDNRPGGGTTIGTAVAARAPGDGHTLLLTAFGYIGNQLMLPSLPYDPKSLAPLAMVAESPSVLYVSSRLPVNTLAELIAYGKAHPGKLSFASSGNGSSPHIAAESFAGLTGLQIVHVPYRGNGPAINDLVGGQVDALFDSPATMAHVASGRLKVLGMGYSAPSARLPNVLPIGQSGVPALSDFYAGGWFGLFVPSTAPEALQRQLHADLRAVMELRDVREAIEKAGGDPRSMSQADFAAYLQRELDRWGPVIRTRNIRPD